MKALIPLISVLAFAAVAQASVLYTLDDDQINYSQPDSGVGLATEGNEIYSNLEGATLGGFPHGSNMLYDDIVPDRTGITDTYLDTLTVSFVNFDVIDDGGNLILGGNLESVDITVEFRAADPVNNLPTDLLGTFTSPLDFSGAPIQPTNGGTAVLDLSGLNLDTTGWEGGAGFFWLGISWSNAVGPVFFGDDAVGQLIFNPPTRGSSLDWVADSNGIFNFGGNPPASFGYVLTTAVPEPATIAVLALGLLMIRRR